MNVHHYGKLISKDRKPALPSGRHKDMKRISGILKHHNDGPHEWDLLRPCACRVTSTKYLGKALKHGIKNY